MTHLDDLATLPVSANQLLQGQLLLDDIRALNSLNAILFDHLRSALVPMRGVVCTPLPRNTRIQSGAQAQSDGRVLELYVGILFHCMGFTVLSCGGGPSDGGVDVKVRDDRTTNYRVVAIQCKQYSRAVVGYNAGLQLIGAMYTTSAAEGVLITPSAASKDVKALARNLDAVRHGELRMHVWDGEQLVRLLGRYSADITDARDAMLDDVFNDGELCDRIYASQPKGHCIRHAIHRRRATEETRGCTCATIEAAASILSNNVSTPSPPMPRISTLPSTTSSSSSAPAHLLTAAPPKVEGDQLESLSSDDEEDDVENANPVAIANRQHNLDKLTTPSRGPVATASFNSRSPLLKLNMTPRTPQGGVPWTEEEEVELQHCVAHIGAGRWTEILEHSDMLRARGKTAMKIRDKWKNMRKRQLGARVRP